MKYKFLNIVCCLTAIVLFGTSCEKGPQFREFNYPAQVPSGLSPASGYPMTNVTITGTNFDSLKGAVKVWFGGIQVTNIVSVKGNEIVVQVPANAVSGKVTLQVWTTKVDSIGTYTVVTPPVISSIASNNPQKNVAFPGDTLTMRGIRFGTDASKMVVAFSGTPANILSPVTDTLFQVVAPASFATGNVTLTMGGLTLVATPAIINPTAAGDITPYFLGNTGDTAKGGGFT
ncbi:MAG TPA: IPT/TIG domain-containing protein, partial [Chitinophagaceae bacterium]|nr:IPT/TIG domain-containing protein [Chitinophagaceae bacterium]